MHSSNMFEGGATQQDISPGLIHSASYLRKQHDRELSGMKASLERIFVHNQGNDLFASSLEKQPTTISPRKKRQERVQRKTEKGMLVQYKHGSGLDSSMFKSSWHEAQTELKQSKPQHLAVRFDQKYELNLEEVDQQLITHVNENRTNFIKQSFQEDLTCPTSKTLMEKIQHNELGAFSPLNKQYMRLHGMAELKKFSKKIREKSKKKGQKQQEINKDYINQNLRQFFREALVKQGKPKKKNEGSDSEEEGF